MSHSPRIPNQPQSDTFTTEQHGGSHYKSMAIQPAYYNQVNHLDWLEGEVVKLVSRHHNKNGKEDIDKAIHYLKMLLEIEYPESE